jgi:hypothetical protein
LIIPFRRLRRNKNHRKLELPLRESQHGSSHFCRISVKNPVSSGASRFLTNPVWRACQETSHAREVAQKLPTFSEVVIARNSTWLLA